MRFLVTVLAFALSSSVATAEQYYLDESDSVATFTNTDAEQHMKTRIAQVNAEIAQAKLELARLRGGFVDDSAFTGGDSLEKLGDELYEAKLTLWGLQQKIVKAGGVIR